MLWFIMQSFIVSTLVVAVYCLAWVVYWVWTRKASPWPAWLLALCTVAFWVFMPVVFSPLLLAALGEFGLPFAWSLLAAALYLVHFVWPALRPKRANLLHDNPGPLLILSSNLLKTNHQNGAIVETIQGLDADLVALQELKPWHAEELERLQTVYPHRVIRPTDDHKGIGLMSKHPLSEVAWVRPKPDSNPALVAKVHAPQGAFWLVNMHTRIPQLHRQRILGLPIPLGADTHERHEDVVDLVALMGTLDGPALLVGDMNTTPECLDYRLIPDTWQNAFEVAGRGWGFSYPVDALFFGVRLPWPIFRIDHLFARGAWQILSARIGAMPGSDHRYLLVALEPEAETEPVAR